MAGSWRWSEAGEPSIDIGLAGYEATPIRSSDVLAWCEMSPSWANLSAEKRESFEARQTKFIASAIAAAAPHIDAFKSGAEVSGSPIWVARDVEHGGKAVARFIFNDPENDDNATRNVGWATHPKYRRRGIAKALATTIITEFAGKIMKLRDVTAECEANNVASIGVLRSVGFKKTGESQDEDGDTIYEYIKVLHP